MAQSDLWWVLVALVACGVALSLLQGLYFEWRLRSLGRMLQAPPVGDAAAIGVGDLVGGLLLTSAQLSATLREARHANLQPAAPAGSDDRYRLARDMAVAGATAAKITEVCGMNPCEAEWVRSVHAARATRASKAAVRKSAASAQPAATTPAPDEQCGKIAGGRKSVRKRTAKGRGRER